MKLEASRSKLEAARQAVASVRSLHEDFVEPVLNALSAAGILEPGDGKIRATATGGLSRIAQVEALAVNDRSIAAALRYAGGQLRQCGTDFDSIIDRDRGEISIEKLHAAMKDKPVSFRLGLKNALAAARLLD